MNRTRRRPRRRFGAVLAVLAIAAGGLAAQAAEQPAASYSVTRNGELLGVFSSCRGMGSVQDVIEHNVVNGDGVEVTLRIPGRLRVPDIICVRPLTSSRTLSTWRMMVEVGDIADARSVVTITALDPSSQPIGVWRLDSAWPVEVQAIGAASGAVEVMRLVSDSVERTQ